jgi:hypothetical protein
MTLTLPQLAAVQQQVLRVATSTAPTPPKTIRRFSVWMAVDIPAHYQTVGQMAAALESLTPAGQWDELELLMKAGEGGSWQSQFDSHPLALSGVQALEQRIAEGAAVGIRITPYVVVRAKTGWVAGEQTMIRQCVQVAGRCVLNVEPGAPYYNGPLDPGFIRGYLLGCQVPASALEVCMIPRAAQVAELGGVACLQAWTDPELVGGASWECYDSIDPGVGPTSLAPDVAIPRLDGWGVSPELQFRICVVQRSRTPVWAETIWAAQALQCWWLDGD